MNERKRLQKEALEALSECEGYSRFLISYFEKYLGKEILEIGSGIGNITRLLNNEERKVIPSDIDKQSLDILNSEYQQVLYLDITSKNSQELSGRFDSLVVLNVLEHIKDDLEALINMRKLLKADGKLILLVPAHLFLYSEYDKKVGHERRYSSTEIKEKLGKSGFNILKLNFVNKIGALGWLYNFKMLKRKSFPKPLIFSINAISGFIKIIDLLVPLSFGLSIICVAEKKK
jgi:SAM-dependent methyltransferase